MENTGKPGINHKDPPGFIASDSPDSSENALGNRVKSSDLSEQVILFILTIPVFPNHPPEIYRRITGNERSACFFKKKRDFLLRACLALPPTV
jgi:hypothetical protein